MNVWFLWFCGQHPGYYLLTAAAQEKPVGIYSLKRTPENFYSRYWSKNLIFKIIIF